MAANAEIDLISRTCRANIPFKKKRRKAMALLPYITDEEATGAVAILFKHNRKLYGRVAFVS